MKHNNTYESVSYRVSPPFTLPTPIPTATAVSLYVTLSQEKR
jgi:hypothetical protein